jgi:LAO/AO transport system kinase
MSSVRQKGLDRNAKRIANFFADWGFDVDIGPAQMDISQTVGMAIENDVHILCLPVVEEKIESFLKEMCRKLKTSKAGTIQIVGIGDVSSSQYDTLINIGLSEVLNPNQDILEPVMGVLSFLVSESDAIKEPGVYIKGVLANDRRMVSKAITLIESGKEEHRTLAKKVLDALYPYAGSAVRIGITGVPGVGKSTFIENFGLCLLEKGHKVAVLAVDPSSSKSGGSILGDKTRMGGLSSDQRAMIRPSPSRGMLGGVSGRTRETMIVCEAAGYDVILVETVGVGQSEYEAASMVDFFLLLMLAGAGDQIQGIKKGIIEMADALGINKADGENLQNAQKARQAYEKALGLVRPALPYWRPPVVTCSAFDEASLDAIWNIIQNYIDKLKAAGELTKKREHQAVDWMMAMVEQGLLDKFMQSPDVKRVLPEMLKAIDEGKTTPTLAATRLLNEYGS